jgi:hypothetical protein
MENDWDQVDFCWLPQALHSSMRRSWLACAAALLLALGVSAQMDYMHPSAFDFESERVPLVVFAAGLTVRCSVLLLRADLATDSRLDPAEPLC